MKLNEMHVSINAEFIIRRIPIILPITFLAMVGPMMKSLAHLAAALVSVIVALALIGLPSGTGLLIAALCAMGTGAAVEMWQEARA